MTQIPDAAVALAYSANSHANGIDIVLKFTEKVESLTPHLM